MKKTCDNCEYVTAHSWDQPCSKCSQLSLGPLDQWQPKKAPIGKCDTCQYHSKPEIDYPCNKCIDSCKNGCGHTYYSPKEAPMKTKIEIIRPVTIASVAAEEPCMTEFIEFCNNYSMYGTKEQIQTASIIHECTHGHPTWKPWLIEHGFIREVEEKPVRERIGVGSLWKSGGDIIYHLTYAWDSKVALLAVDFPFGHWSCPAKVNDIMDISDSEWSAITGYERFTRVHGHLEFVEDK